MTDMHFGNIDHNTVISRDMFMSLQQSDKSLAALFRLQ